MRTSNFSEKPKLKLSSLNKQNNWYLIYSYTDKAFKGTVVNHTLPSLVGGSLEITLTVPSVNITGNY